MVELVVSYQTSHVSSHVLSQPQITRAQAIAFKTRARLALDINT